MHKLVYLDMSIGTAFKLPPSGFMSSCSLHPCLSRNDVVTVKLSFLDIKCSLHLIILSYWTCVWNFVPSSEWTLGLWPKVLEVDLWPPKSSPSGHPQISRNIFNTSSHGCRGGKKKQRGDKGGKTKHLKINCFGTLSPIMFSKTEAVKILLILL